METSLIVTNVSVDKILDKLFSFEMGSFIFLDTGFIEHAQLFLILIYILNPRKPMDMKKKSRYSYKYFFIFYFHNEFSLKSL